MERRGNRQNHGALRAELRGNLHGALHRARVPGDHRLLRRIQICGRTNFSPPAATSAEYSPRLCPATKSGVNPFSASTRYTATEQVKIAGCVLAVSLRSASVPSKHNFEIEKPSALSASSKTAFAAGYFPASSLPIPGYCEA